MTTTVRIVVEGRQNVVAVPNGALRRDERGTFTLVATPAGSERRGVVPGFRGSDFTEVASGLQPGDRVLLGRGECLADSTARTEP
jgi:multidrug efflux pump subunit AcrA (membrane-fusion protein)